MMLKKNGSPAPNIGPDVRMPIIGTVSLGEKVENQNGKTFPKSAGHFVIKTTDPFWQGAILDVYGDRPQRLYVAPVGRLNESISHSLELRLNGKLVGMSDNVHLWKKPNASDKLEFCDAANVHEAGGIEKAKQMLSDFYKAEWKERIMFQFFLLPLKVDEGDGSLYNGYENTTMPMGAFRLHSGGQETMQGILSALEKEWSRVYAMDYAMKTSPKGIYPVISLLPLVNMSAMSKLSSGAQNLLGE